MTNPFNNMIKRVAIQAAYANMLPTNLLDEMDDHFEAVKSNYNLKTRD